MKYDDIQVGRLYKLGERVRKGIYPEYVYAIGLLTLNDNLPIVRTIIFDPKDRTYNMHGQDFIAYYEIVEDGT